MKYTYLWRSWRHFLASNKRALRPSTSAKATRLVRSPPCAVNSDGRIVKSAATRAVRYREMASAARLILLGIHAARNVMLYFHISKVSCSMIGLMDGEAVPLLIA